MERDEIWIFVDIDGSNWDTFFLIRHLNLNLGILKFQKIQYMSITRLGLLKP